MAPRLLIAATLLLCALATPPAAATAREFVVTAFGAIGDATPTNPGTNNTAAVRKAAAAVAAAGGGVLVIPAGNFSTGAFNLSSDMVLRLEPGATVSGIQPRSLSTAAYDYPVVPWLGTGGADAYGGASDFQGEMGPQYQSFVHGYQLKNVTIEGGGTIWGGGDFWWRMWAGHGNQAKGSSPLNMSRPHTIHLVDVKGLTIRDVAVRRSPSWTVHLTFCSCENPVRFRSIFLTNYKYRACQSIAKTGSGRQTQGKPNLNGCHPARRDVLVDSIHVQTNDSSATGAAYEPANADGLDIDSCTDVVVRRTTRSSFSTHFPTCEKYDDLPRQAREKRKVM